MAGLSLLAALVASSASCPFCSAQGQTLSGEVAQADLIVLGNLTNAQADPADPTRGRTDLTVRAVVKPHPYLDGRPVLTLPRYLPNDAKAEGTLFLVYATVSGRPTDAATAAAAGGAVFANPSAAGFDPYRGVPVPPGSVLPDYLKGAIAVREKDTTSRLRYFFDYLDNADPDIAQDAMMEFGNTDYKDVRTLAVSLPADRVLKWLQNPGTPASRYGLYGLFLGHCGKPADAPTVRALLDDPKVARSSGIDGLMAAYVMLDPAAGWAYLNGLVTDGKQDFSVHYAALRTLRFFWEYRPDVLPPEKVLDAVKALVAHKDLADLPMDDLRKWGRWELTDYVLGFAKQDSHAGVPIIKRAILKFALSAPKDNAAAKAYVDEVRKADPDRVRYVEQLLADEAPLKK
jgi:hypothetical protein